MNTQELLWKYAEGQCSGQEKAEVEKILATDESAVADLRLIQEIHASLSGMEAEQPAMRFSQNVVEALPKNLYVPIDAEPLLPPYFKVIFGSILASIFALFFFVSKSKSPANTGVQYYSKIDEFIEIATKLISPDIVLYGILAFISLAILAVFDRFFATGNFINRWR